jgi:hypothetical protein
MRRNKVKWTGWHHAGEKRAVVHFRVCLNV